MFGLTAIGLAHTALAVAAIGTLIAAWLRDGRVSSGKPLGQLYLGVTTVTALTAFGIYRTGAPGPGHALAVFTLVGVAAAIFYGRRGSRALESGAIGATVFGHLIPGVTETLVRVPAGAPYASSPDDPALVPFQLAAVVLGAVFIGLQVRAGR